MQLYWAASEEISETPFNPNSSSGGVLEFNSEYLSAKSPGSSPPHVSYTGLLKFVQLESSENGGFKTKHNHSYIVASKHKKVIYMYFRKKGSYLLPGH